MFIELTDHLRCPADHAESFLVLVPDRMEGRRVMRGTLGCPHCLAEHRIEEGVVLLGAETAPSWGGEGAESPDAAGALALLGIEGPGGYLALLGSAAALADELGELLPGVHFVLVNPPAGTAPTSQASVVRASRIPLKIRSMRGLILGGVATADAAWLEQAVRAVLPGLRVVGAGAPPVLEGFELLAAAGGWWVGRAG